MGEDYQSSGAEEEPERTEDDVPPEGDLADPESLASKYQAYLKLKKKYEEENAQSDDEIQQLDIKTAIQNELKESNQNKISQKLLSEAFRWRLS